MRALAAALLVAAVLPAAGARARAAAPGRLPEGWYADVDTSLGTFTIHLLPEQAPQTVAYFVGFAEGTIEYPDAFTGEMVKRPLYDGLKIHKVVFMERFEAGDPTGTGRGAPPFWVPREIGPYDFSRAYRVGMTGSSGGLISGALFFVAAVPEPSYNHVYNCFGEVVRGRDVVDAIVRVRTDEHKVPVKPVVIERVRVQKIGNPPPIPAPVRYRPRLPVLTPRVPGSSP